MSETEELPKISIECHKLMFAMAVWAARRFFCDVPDEETVKWCAMFELSGDQTLAASKEFAELCLAFRADRERTMAQWMKRNLN